ncbi:TetR/AcrR family transcriptional regulator [Salinibacterium sp. TMP30]|uniref:TetR/AcrR family transcriptional regulator n=1 Tax=Salinibacterium sp. TMP30 TaxID=3138237 RepID=UPI0031388ACC
MTTTRHPGLGRPPAASRELLQEAAFELFVENGYIGTTVDQIATRAGVSRNTFFNYFDAKGDVFWVELDAMTERLKVALAAGSSVASTAPTAVFGIRNAVLAAIAPLDSEHVPFVLTQYDMIGSITELQASAMSRFTSQARLLGEYLRRNGVHSDAARAQAYSLIACVIAAAQEWAQAGPQRGRLEPYVQSAIDVALNAE